MGGGVDIYGGGGWMPSRYSLFFYYIYMVQHRLGLFCYIYLWFAIQRPLKRIAHNTHDILIYSGDDHCKNNIIIFDVRICICLGVVFVVVFFFSRYGDSFNYS